MQPTVQPIASSSASYRGDDEDRRDGYGARTDTNPEFFNFLSSLRSDDLIAELIQNEIDAGSTTTLISFEPDRLLCSGDGAPVDADGWLRLSYLRGAGDKVPRKEGLIGIKNHGIKACFTVGDEVFIRSAGKQAHQTLYRNGPTAKPSPAALLEPRLDASAPLKGCLIEVPYRVKTLVSDLGEQVALQPATPEHIAVLFKTAVAEVAQRFIGAHRPNLRPHYTLELRHHDLGNAVFEFRIGRPLIGNGITSFSRICEVTGTAAGTQRDLRERVALRAVGRPQNIERDVSAFYRQGTKLLVEIAWGEGEKGRLSPGRGALRYPIAYPNTGLETGSGFAVHYSAPFVSDTERHGLAGQADGWNGGLIAMCDALLVDVLRKLVSRFGARALALLGADDAPEGRLTSLVLALERVRALPVISPRQATGKKPKTRGGAVRTARKGGPRSVGQRMPPSETLVVPSYAGSPEKHSTELAAAAPRENWLLAGDTPVRVRAVLTNKSLEGWGGDVRTTFDEHDARNRLRQFGHDGPDHFPWSDEASWHSGISNVEYARRLLDAILGVRNRPKDGLDPPGADLYLPDTVGQPTPLAELAMAAKLPTGLPGVTFPPLLHPDLADHPIFKFKGWKRGVFGFERFLGTIEGTSLSESTAKALFAWLERNPKGVPPAFWNRFRALPIWPDICGEMGPLDRLCAPRIRETEKILASALAQPAATIRKIAAALKARRLALPVRDLPDASELAKWLQSRIEGLPLDRPLAVAERQRFSAFERDAAALAADRRIAVPLRAVSVSVPALNKAGVLADPGSLVSSTSETRRLALNPQDVLDRSETTLDDLWPPAPAPSADAVRRALVADTENGLALIPRLQALAVACGHHEHLAVEHIRCIPIHGVFHAPRTLAFKGTRGDFWGRQYRNEITGTGLGQVDQRLYVRAGVLASEPTSTTSRAFFQWLGEDRNRVEPHLAQILRHFRHEHGVGTWWTMYPQMPCVPVIGVDGYSLVSRNVATSNNQRVYIDDFPELGAAIRKAYGQIKLVVDKHESVISSIAEMLEESKVRSLRRSIKLPDQITGVGIEDAPAWVGDVLTLLRSNRMARSLQKKLLVWGLSSKLLHGHWQNRLDGIKRVVSASQITATYPLGNQRVRADVSRAFAPQSGTLWLLHSSDDGRNALEVALFATLAERLFIDGAPPYCALALAEALRTDIVEVKRAKVSKRMFQQEEAKSEDDEQEMDFNDGENKDEPGEAPDAHHDWKPDPTKNMPDPKPLPRNNLEPAPIPVQPPPKPPPRIKIPDEDAQREALKRDHYAWHCQISLAHADPLRLAPKGSYAEDQENRAKMIDAHHADAVAAGGARHAGNLLILSHLEHHRIGRRLSREQITDALRLAEPKTVTFGKGKNSKVVTGAVANVLIPTTGEFVAIFFTDWHKRYWLEGHSDSLHE